MEEESSRIPTADAAVTATTEAGKEDDPPRLLKRTASCDDENDTLDENSHNGKNNNVDEKKEESRHQSAHTSTGTHIQMNGNGLPDSDDLGYNDPSGLDALDALNSSSSSSSSAREDLPSDQSLGSDFSMGTGGYIAEADTVDSGNVNVNNKRMYRVESELTEASNTQHSNADSIASSPAKQEEEEEEVIPRRTSDNTPPKVETVKDDDDDSDSFQSCSSALLELDDSDSDSSVISESMNFSDIGPRSRIIADPGGGSRRGGVLSRNEASGNLRQAPRGPTSSKRTTRRGTRGGRGMPTKPTARPAPTRIPRSARIETARGLGSSLHSSSNDDTPKRPSFLLKKAVSERFSFKADNEEDTIFKPRFKQKKFRSRSMDLSGSGRSDEGGPPIVRSATKNSFTRYSVAFGASREQNFYQPTVIRKSRKMDIQTGAETYREVICQRIIDYPDAMNPNERRRKTVLRTGPDIHKQESMHGLYLEPQYRMHTRIQSNAVSHNMSRRQQCSNNPLPKSHSVRLSNRIVCNGVVVLVQGANTIPIARFGAGTFDELLDLVTAIKVHLGAAVGGSGILGNEGGLYFIDAYSLSWTTFSTVGYGLVHPAVRTESDDIQLSCSFLTTISALEAFVGVLFASFCGAVVVGKMTRAKSTASVQFSQRMILRFGTGVMYTEDDDDRIDDRNEKPVSKVDTERAFFPCPVLEFRLANTLFGDDTGEILDARISVVGSTLANKEPDNSSTRTGVMGTVMSGGRPSLEMIKGMGHSASVFLRSKVPVRFGDIDQTWSTGRGAFKSSRSGLSSRSVFASSGYLSRTKKNILWSSSKGSLANSTTSADIDSSEKVNHVLKRVSTKGASKIESVIVKKRLLRTASGEAMGEITIPQKAPKRRHAICVEEDPTSGLSPKKLFSGLKLECDTHPFLKRVWTIRHVLNAESPLLSERAVRIIRDSRGRWPTEICNHTFIRENVDFQQLIVSLSGTVTGTRVYGLHVYDYRNLHVGYTFAPNLRRSQHGRLEVDIDSIDNIRVQRGGGAEPIDIYESRPNRDENATKKELGRSRHTGLRNQLLKYDPGGSSDALSPQSDDDSVPLQTARNVQKISLGSLNRGITEECSSDLADSSMFHSQTAHGRTGPLMNSDPGMPIFDDRRAAARRNSVD
ncbi:expressed unknown protein [Seminavis robusta]|uniref:Uncharacterized protein n=1 Tax=Seminavis robusta TaxID=568900 RepID=A0A9N8H3R2_9STRA|nr:expressed unknown protein [Seminavis robusta]|eukprot:Sro67_g037530.1 n/a (1149) ;mRNA; f:49447-53073